MRKAIGFFTAVSVCVAIGASPAFAGKDNDTLVWATASEVDTVDLYYQNLREVVIMAHQICDTLMWRDPATLDYKPLLAKSYTWTDDTTLDFALRENVKFHDGSDFDAEDVAYTLNHAAAPDSGVVTREVVDWIDQVEALSPHKVRIHLKHPFPAALEYLSGITPIYPEGHYDKAPEVPGAEGQTRKDYGAVQPVCTGPYEIAGFTPGQSVEMLKNEDYFEGSPKGQPAIGKLVFKTIPDAQTQVAELITGGLDWIWGVPKDNAEQLDAMENVTVVQAPTMRVSFLSMDAAGRSGENPFTDVRVRRAVNHAVDKKAIANNLVGSAAEVLNAACFTTQFGCTQDVPSYPYDPEKAKQLLAEAGHPNGFEVDLYAYRDRPYSEAVLGYLSEVGIDANLKFMQWKALRPIIYDGQATFAHLTWGSQGVNDISAITPHYFTFGPDDYAHDEEVKELLEQAGRTADAEQRKQLYKEALTRIAEEAYWAPLFSYARFYAFNADLDFKPTPDEIAHFYMASWKD